MKLYELFEFYKNESNKFTEFSVVDTNKQEFIISNSGDKNSYYLKAESTETGDYYCLTDIFTSDELMEFEVIKLPETIKKVGISRGCFTGDALVTTKNGFKELKDVKVGDYVITADGQFNRVNKTHKYNIE